MNTSYMANTALGEVHAGASAGARNRAVDGTAVGEVEREVLRLLRSVRYGSVEVTIHDSRVVQVESREKVRIGDNVSRKGGD